MRTIVLGEPVPCLATARSTPCPISCSSSGRKTRVHPGRDDIQLHTVVPAWVSVPVLGLDYDGARRSPEFKVTEAGESLLGRLLHE